MPTTRRPESKRMAKRREVSRSCSWSCARPHEEEKEAKMDADSTAISVKRSDRSLNNRWCIRHEEITVF